MPKLEDFASAYLFGSILCKNNPNDIDVLLIYTQYSSSLLEIVKNVQFDLENFFQLPVHLTVLSNSELKSTNFLAKIKNYFRIK